MKHGHAKRTGLSPLYVRWAGIKQRCTDKNHAAYKNYGGRGITLHPTWFDFATFAAAVGEPPTPKHHLDRINNDKGYMPGNVRWVTQAENNRNSRRCHVVTIDGISKPIFEWLAHFKLNRRTYDARIMRGMRIVDALTTPVIKRKTK